MNATFWDNRFDAEPELYGRSPSIVLVDLLTVLPTGKALFIAEGQGRNAIYAAKHGWDVVASDSSTVARSQAIEWATKEGVTIDYLLADTNSLAFESNTFDLIALIYAHQPSADRRLLYSKFSQWLKPSGIVLLEGFTTKQLNYHSGGPKSIDWLYDPETVVDEFKGLEPQSIVVKEVLLNEGKGHEGLGSVVHAVFARGGSSNKQKRSTE